MVERFTPSSFANKRSEGRTVPEGNSPLVHIAFVAIAGPLLQLAFAHIMLELYLPFRENLWSSILFAYALIAWILSIANLLPDLGSDGSVFLKAWFYSRLGQTYTVEQIASMNKQRMSKEIGWLLFSLLSASYFIASLLNVNLYDFFRVLLPIAKMIF